MIPGAHTLMCTTYDKCYNGCYVEVASSGTT